jgi:cystathionine gamma-lyase
VLEANIATLEQGRHCRVYSSGLAATSAIANWVPTGGHVVLTDDGYGGIQRYFRKISQDKHGVHLDFVDFTQLDQVKRALKPNTKVSKGKVSLGRDTKESNL